MSYGLNVFPTGGNEFIEPKVELTGNLVISAVKSCVNLDSLDIQVDTAPIKFLCDSINSHKNEKR